MAARAHTSTPMRAAAWPWIPLLAGLLVLGTILAPPPEEALPEPAPPTPTPPSQERPATRDDARHERPTHGDDGGGGDAEGADDAEDADAAGEDREAAPPAPAVRFLAMGDTGIGNDGQRQVAEAARRVCEAHGCDFVLGLGDNVYDDGASHPHDPLFEARFEAPYANLTLPFHMTLGNHDAGRQVRVGNATLDNGDVQVLYASRADRASDKWRMPDRYYAFERADVAFFALDLTHHAAGYDVDDATRARLREGQAAWLDAALRETAARWRIAFGHFPYASNGQHGDAAQDVKAFLDAHACGRVDLYLAGHDHDLQWLKPHDGCPGTELVVSGAAAVPRPLASTRHDAWFQQGDALGFFWFEIDGDRLVGRAHDAEGRALFERVVHKPAATTPEAP